MLANLRIAERDWLRLRKHFGSSFRSNAAPETGALAIVGECSRDHRRDFIVSEILIPGPGDLKVATTGALVFDSSFIRRAHLKMRSSGLVGIATFHTHPGSTTHVSFSSYDNQQDPLLIENLTELEPRSHLVSVVAGQSSQCGRYFNGSGIPQPLDQLIVVGERLSFLPLTGRAPARAPHPSAIFDRGTPLTGSGALATLARMTIAVVGASGTGSLLCELLVRAGCRHILLIDHDIVREINLNRILHATADDALRGVPKVDVLRRAIEAIGIGCRVEPIHGTILDIDVLRRVLDADFVFGCVDRALPRHLLCELSARYLLPYIDVGSEIGGDARGIVCLDSRVSYIAPGRHCLMCSGVVTSRELNFESLSASERQRKMQLGYSNDLVIEKPAVMDLNMRAASMGMLVLRHLLQPYLLEPLPVAISENAVTYTTIPVSVARNSDPACPTCKANPRFGYGDCGPAIGFDYNTVGAILGPEGLRPVDSADTELTARPGRPHFLMRLASSLFQGAKLFYQERRK